MACICKGKGFIETDYMRDDALRSIISQCPRRCNIEGYSRRVQIVLSGRDFSRAQEFPEVFVAPDAIRGAPCEIIPLRR